MSNEDDIREIFRRAFEQSERRTINPETGEEEPPSGPPRRAARPALPSGWWRDRRLWIGLIIFLLFISFNWAVTTYTDWLWFQNVGFTDVWVKSWSTRVVSFLLFFIVAFAILRLNARFAVRGAVASSQSAFKPGEFSGFGLFLTAIALFLSFSFASAAGGMWEEFLLFLNRVNAGVNDPVFGRNLSFYFFELPVYSFLRSWLLPLLFFSLIGVVAIYAIHNLELLRASDWRPQTVAPLRRHAAILAAIIALLIAVGHLLERYTLLYSSRASDLVAGAGYTDVNVTLRILLLNATLMVIVALAFLLNISRLNLRLLVLAVGLWLFSLIVLSGILPSLVQRYVVEPNKLSRESPYLADNIEYTRRAFQLDEIETRDFGDVTPLTAEDLAENADALSNIRLWDYRVLPDNYEQLQALRQYYQFGDVDIDRYEIDGETRQVMLATRELDKSEAGLENQTWENLRLEFTHGYGIVMNPVDRFTRDGQPSFFISDIPSRSTIDLEVTRPEIYYGEEIALDDYVFAGSPRTEFSYPSGTTNVRTVYEGSGGVPLGGALNKLAFAIRFGDINILLNGDLTPETRIMFDRQIVERINKITPFLLLDPDPYMVLADDGRLFWMIDAYTVSQRYPYSEGRALNSIDPRLRSSASINYMRNAAKIVVDAYNGTVTYYVIGEDDPITATYAQVFPSLFRPIADMPASLQDNIRYPELMFRAQALQNLKYHMTDLNTFFNKEDLWVIPNETFRENSAAPIEPYYVNMRLPGEAQSEYLLIQPYTPANRDNMVAWMAARNDAPNYGELVVYTLPKQQVVDGPIQVEAQIEQDSDISPQLSLWNDGSSSAIRGNLIVIPINNSFLYVEPLYLQSEGGGSRPELKRVIVGSGGDVVMRETLGEALAALVDASQTAVIPTAGADSNEQPISLEGVEITEAVQQLIESANTNFEAAQAAQQAGDWAAYGEALELLEADLQQLLELSP